MSSTKSFSDISAQRYAAALYEIAMEDSMLDKVENEVNILSQLLKLSSEFRSIISNPSVSKKDQTKVIIKIAEKGNFSEIFGAIFVIIPAIMGFIGCQIDSVLGATLENRGIIGKGGVNFISIGISTAFSIGIFNYFY